MNEYKMFAMKVNRDQFEQLMDDYSESGYTNSSYSDIIIDLFNVEDHREEFAGLIGLPLDELPTNGYMNLYP
jgi:hypothetical protein